ncbi:ATP-binding protein [Streptomyces mirabilis]|uniref:ATP-binding protein n=1 Tax=Streptomyces mirabilis TaxID=68239 RepID=UPI00369A436A
MNELPASFPAVMVTLPATVAAVRVGRRLVSEALAFWGLDAAVVYDAEVIMSELLTNAVKHAADVNAEADRRPFRGLNLVAPQARVQDSSLFLEVWDGSPTPPTYSVADDASEGGRGLPVIDALSERWGVWPGGLGGKVVYAEVAIKDPPPVSIDGHIVPLPREVTRESVPGIDGQHAMANTALLARIIEGF